jgi:hypothetical protein
VSSLNYSELYGSDRSKTDQEKSFLKHCSFMSSIQPLEDENSSSSENVELVKSLDKQEIFMQKLSRVDVAKLIEGDLERIVFTH